MNAHWWEFTLELADRPAQRGEKHWRAALSRWKSECDQFAEEYGIKKADFLYRIDLSTLQVPAILDQIQNWTAEGRGYLGIGKLIEKTDAMPCDPQDRDWRQLNPQFQLHIHFQGPDEAVESGKGPYRAEFDSAEMAPDRHICSIPNPFAYGTIANGSALPQYLCVSERFVEVVQRHELKGIEFFYIADSGRYAAQQWHLAAQQHSLGRGLDHPWVDPSAYYRRRSDEAGAFTPNLKKQDSFNRLKTVYGLGRQDPALAGAARDVRFGIHSFSNMCRRPEKGFKDPQLNRIFKLYDRQIREKLGWSPENVDLQISGPLCVLADSLPNADFAYHGTHEYTEPGMGSALYMSPRAARILIENEVLAGENLHPGCFKRVRVMDTTPPGVLELDHLGPAPPAPHLQPALLNILRRESNEALHRHLAHPRPRFQADMERALRLVSELREVKPAHFALGAADEDLNQAELALGFPIPQSWKRLMRASAKILFEESGVETLLPAELARQTNEYREAFRSCNGAFPNGQRLVIAVECNGDCYALDASRTHSRGEECPVIRVNHEISYHYQREWPTIAQFLESMAIAELNAE